MNNKLDRIKNTSLHSLVVGADEAASWIKDGMTLGLSGFTRAGDAKAIPFALVDRAKNEKFKVNVLTGASLGSDIDKLMSEADIVNIRSPFQAEPAMRKNINEGKHHFIDCHLSHMSEMIRNGAFPAVDFAVVEAVAITEDNMIIPTTSVGNSPTFISQAKNIIIELNLAASEQLIGLHDIYEPAEQGNRGPIPVMKASDRIGTIGIPFDPEKVRGIVITDYPDSASTILPPDEETETMANHLLDFLRGEVTAGRLTNNLAPLQAGIGSVANAVMLGMINSEFEDLEIYSEVLQDNVFDLIDAGKVNFASGCSMTLSGDKMEQVYREFDKYSSKLLFRPQEISNNPEIIRRLGLISINTALEFDIYGNVNSTHVAGTKMMNGIGGSGDFARNARLAIFVTKSIAKNGKISSIVPFVSHVDHTEHDVDVVVTEQGFADLRGLAPRQRAEKIIANCVHPMYREQLLEYYEEAKMRGGHTPHVLEKAFSFHEKLASKGTMLDEVNTLA